MIMKVDHACTEPQSIARLEALIKQLPDNAHVRLHLTDGSQCEGIVSARPGLETVRDEALVEGINARLRLEGGGAPDPVRLIWLDRVERVEHLDSMRRDESRSE